MSPPETLPPPSTSAAGSLLWGPFSRTGLWVAIATALIDQAHKWWMIIGYQIKLGERIYVTPFMDWVFVLNRGISYSLFSLDTLTGQLILAVFAVIVSAGMWMWLARGGTSRLMGASLGLVMGGAIGNAIDRLTLGGVADFFSLHAFGYYWYVFNIADVAIVAGVAGLLYDSLLTSRNAAANQG